MKVYLIHTPNGDIYHRTDEFIMDDIHDHMDNGDCMVECWDHDIHLEDHRLPVFTLEGNTAINEWITQRVEK